MWISEVGDSSKGFRKRWPRASKGGGLRHHGGRGEGCGVVEGDGGGQNGDMTMKMCAGGHEQTGGYGTLDLKRPVWIGDVKTKRRTTKEDTCILTV